MLSTEVILALLWTLAFVLRLPKQTKTEWKYLPFICFALGVLSLLFSYSPIPKTNLTEFAFITWSLLYIMKSSSEKGSKNPFLPSLCAACVCLVLAFVLFKISSPSPPSESSSLGDADRGD